MIHSSTLVRETAVPAQPLRWIASRSAWCNAQQIRVINTASLIALAITSVVQHTYTVNGRSFTSMAPL